MADTCVPFTNPPLPVSPPKCFLDGPVLPAASSFCPSQNFTNNWQEPGQFGTESRGRNRQLELGMRKTEWKKKREEKGLGREGEKKVEGAIRGIHFSAQISETESLIGSSVLRNSQIYFPSSSILLQNVTFPLFVFLCDPTATKGFPQRPKGLGCKVHVLHIKSKFFCFFYFLCFLFF